jgi:hypothetical protein
MTHDKAFKTAIRARMAQAGEPYSVARRAVLSDAGDATERAAEPDSSAHVTSDPGETEDYYERYAREARLAGLPEEQIAVQLARMTAQDQTAQSRALADRATEAADRAQDRADAAEEEAGSAEERAELAHEAAAMAEEWAEDAERARAQKRAGQLQEQAERARERADQAQEAADRAQEWADRVSEAADKADEGDAEVDYEDEDQDQSWRVASRVTFPGPLPRVPRLPRPPRPPRPFRPASPWGGQDDVLMSRLDRLHEKFEQAQERLHEHIEQAQERAAEILGQFGTDRDRG